MTNATLSREPVNAKHVGIWIRVSTEDQARGDSPEHHEKRAHDYAESNQWKVKEVSRQESDSINFVTLPSRLHPTWPS